MMLLLLTWEALRPPFAQHECKTYATALRTRHSAPFLTSLLHCGALMLANVLPEPDTETVLFEVLVAASCSPVLFSNVSECR